MIKEYLSTFYNETGVDANTVFTVFVTFFIFGLGLIVNWLINWLKYRADRRNYIRTVNLLLFTLGKDFKRQHDLSLKSMATNSLITNKVNPIQLLTLTPLFVLNKMEYSLFIKYYVVGCNKKIKSKAATKVFDIIGFANIIVSDTEETLKGWLDQLNPIQKEYIESVVALEHLESDFYKKEVIDYDFKQEFNDIFKNYISQKKDNNFKPSFDNLILPLKNLLKKYPYEPTAAAFKIPVESAFRAYSDIYNMDMLMTQHLKNLTHTNLKFHRLIKVILKIFKYREYR